MRWKRPWLELQPREGEPVWLLIESRGLDTGPVLPETIFAKAMTSYLNFRVNAEENSFARTVESLAQFRQIVGPVDDPMLRVPLALADVIEGTLGLPTTRYPVVHADASTAAPAIHSISAKSKASLVEAAQQLPTNGDVLNLAAISRIPGCCEGAGAPARIREIQSMLERADELERGNLKIARNLLHWYDYLATMPDENLPFDRATLVARRRDAATSLAAWASLGSR